MFVKQETRVESEDYIIVASDGTECMVSEGDWLFLVGYNWDVDGWGYFRCSNGGTWNGNKINSRRLHQFVAERMGLKISDGYQIDHINRNKLDNRRSNLRVASFRLQTQNRSLRKTSISGYTGVSFKSSSGKYVAQIHINGKGKHLGYFDDPKGASEAYQAEKKIRDNKEIQRVKECLMTP